MSRSEWTLGKIAHRLYWSSQQLIDQFQRYGLNPSLISGPIKLSQWILYSGPVPEERIANQPRSLKLSNPLPVGPAGTA